MEGNNVKDGRRRQNDRGQDHEDIDIRLHGSGNRTLHRAGIKEAEKYAETYRNKNMKFQAPGPPGKLQKCL